MEEKIDIKNIYFGKSKAESEKNELHNYFVSTRAYRNAKDDRKRKLFYIAHRGSGKSALFNQLYHELAEKKNNVLVQISPSEFSYETFTKIKHDFYDVKASYSIAWEYILIVQLFQKVSKYFKDNSYFKKNRNNVKIIDDYLVKNKLKPSQSRLELFIDFLSRIDVSKINIEFKGFKVSSDNNQEQIKKLVGLYNLDDIRKPLNALSQITEQHPIYLFIDELDTGWNNSEEARNFISGLITATLKINNIPGITIFLSLRQDMYSNLSTTFDDTEKIRDDIEIIEWDKDSLIAMICNRIKENPEVKNKLKFGNYISNKEILNIVFEEGTFEYLMNGTLHRPREIIHYCNLAIEEFTNSFLDRRLFSKKIDNEIINSIKQKFSRGRYADFCSEFNHEFPDIKSLLDNFEGEFIKYPIDAFYHKLEECILYFEEKNSELVWTKEYYGKPSKLMIKLFQIGFIKISLNGSNKFFAYFEKQPQNFRNVKYIAINEVFITALDCIDEVAPDKEY